MATKLGLYNAALRECKCRRLSTLSDNNVGRRVLDDVYAEAVKYALEWANWNFALRPVSVAASAGEVSGFGYDYVFEKPSDWVKTAVVSASEGMIPPLENYRDETGRWIANVDLLYVSYVSNGTSYGLNLARWPAFLARAVSFDLAARICPSVTSDEDSDRLDQKAEHWFKRAKAKDAVNDAPRFFSTGRLVAARSGGVSNRFEKLD